MPTDPDWTTVLDLRQLRVELREGSGLHADSGPFRGTIKSAWFADDLRALRTTLTGLAGTDDDVSFTVGGYRAAELRVTGGWTTTGRELWLTARVTPNGDDPYPTLEMLLYAQPADLVARLDGLDAVLAAV